MAKRKNNKKVVLTVNDSDVKCTIGKKVYGVDMNGANMRVAENAMRKFLVKNTELSDYEEDCMWMSYRYCIGRKSIAAHMHAGDIWKNCRGRMSLDRQTFTAYDINNSIENIIRFSKPYFSFPLLSANRIYATAVDVVCEFIEEYGIKSVDEYLKYRTVDVILTDNERGYKFETTTWEEWLKGNVFKIVSEACKDNVVTNDSAWEKYTEWKESGTPEDNIFSEKFKSLEKELPSSEYFFMSDFEDLFVWNDLAHCFDNEHHHKSVLLDGSEAEWFWSWIQKTEQHEDGKYYSAFGYKKVRIPVDTWNGSINQYIPDSSIIKDLY